MHCVSLMVYNGETYGLLILGDWCIGYVAPTFDTEYGIKKNVMGEMRCATILWDMFRVFGLMEVYNVFFSHPPCLFSFPWNIMLMGMGHDQGI